MGATLTATIALSFLGTAGTLTGLALGAAMSAVLPTLYENLVRRSQHKAKMLRERQRQTRADASSAGDYEFLFTSGESASRPRLSFPWKRMGVAALAVFAICAVTITVVEAIAGKPVSDVVTNTRGSGYTFSGGHTDRHNRPPQAPEQQNSTAPASPTTTPSSTPSATVTPSVTPSAAPSASASAAPSGSASAAASAASAGN